MQRAAPEKRLGRLTQRIHVSRLALLNPVMVCGNLLRNVSLPIQRNGRCSALFGPSMNKTPELRTVAAYPHAASGRYAETSGADQTGEFQNLRAMSMTTNERSRPAIPHQGARNLSSRAWISLPRGRTATNESRRELAGRRRTRHGIARAIEGLRGVRLPLVPDPGSRQRVLRWVCHEIEGVSLA